MFARRITTIEQRDCCVNIIKEVLQSPEKGHKFVVEGSNASGKLSFTRALADILREHGRNVNIIDVALSETEIPKEKILTIKDSFVVLEIHPNLSDDDTDVETTTLHLDPCERNDVEAFKKDIRDCLIDR